MKNAGRVPPPPYYPDFGEGKATGAWGRQKTFARTHEEKSEVKEHGTAVTGKDKRVTYGTASGKRS